MNTQTVNIELLPASELLVLKELKDHPVKSVRALAGFANQELSKRLDAARTELHHARLDLQYKENMVRELLGYPLLTVHGASDNVDDPDATDFQPW